MVHLISGYEIYNAPCRISRKAWVQYKKLYGELARFAGDMAWFIRTCLCYLYLFLLAIRYSAFNHVFQFEFKLSPYTLTKNKMEDKEKSWANQIRKLTRNGE
jgi:hypothetical protein